jgi:hypothetical protein
MAFPDFQNEPPNFISMEIGTNIKAGITPFVVQLVAITKLVCPLRGGTSLKIIPLHVQTFTIHVQVAILLMNLGKVVKSLSRNMLNLLILHLLY